LEPHFRPNNHVGFVTTSRMQIGMIVFLRDCRHVAKPPEVRKITWHSVPNANGNDRSYDSTVYTHNRASKFSVVHNRDVFGYFVQRDSSTLSSPNKSRPRYSIGKRQMSSYRPTIHFFALRDISQSLSSTIKSKFPFVNFIDLDKMATISPTAQKILATLARLRHLHDDDETRQHVAALSCLRMNSTFRNTCAKLKTMNLIEFPTASSIRITSHGMQVAHDLSGGVAARLTTTNEAIQEEIKTKFLLKHKKALQLFELMVDGRDYNKRELAIRVGCPIYNSTIRNAFAFLKSRSIVEYPNNGSIRLANMCFPFGRGR
jgi:hypothetical protein